MMKKYDPRHRNMAATYIHRNLAHLLFDKGAIYKNNQTRQGVLFSNGLIYVKFNLTVI